MYNVPIIKAALMWTMKYGDTNTNIDWKEVFVENFMSSIQYHKIPANVLMNEVEPLKLVPYEVIMTSLAYQVRNKYQSNHSFLRIINYGYYTVLKFYWFVNKCS